LGGGGVPALVDEAGGGGDSCDAAVGGGGGYECCEEESGGEREAHGREELWLDCSKVGWDAWSGMLVYRSSSRRNYRRRSDGGSRVFNHGRYTPLYMSLFTRGGARATPTKNVLTYHLILPPISTVLLCSRQTRDVLCRLYCSCEVNIPATSRHTGAYIVRNNMVI
jgi:hypothetical protein